MSANSSAVVTVVIVIVRNVQKEIPAAEVEGWNECDGEDDRREQSEVGNHL